MGESKVIFISGGEVNPAKHNWCSGIDITYIKSRKVLSIGGWYDDFVGIQSVEIPLDKFCELLGIKRT